MDLALFGRVLWRFRYLVGGALALGLVLAFLTYQSSGDQQRWTSESTLFVTQRGFPWGRVAIPVESAPPLEPGQGPTAYTPEYADPGRLSGLALLYSQLAQSDEVRALAQASGPIDPGALIVAEPVLGGADGDEGLPLIRITTVDSTAKGTLALTARVTTAFEEYLRTQQERGGIPRDERVIVEVVKQPGAEVPGVAALVTGRSLTRPLVLFVALALAAIGLAFILENLRPRSAGPDSDPPAVFDGAEDVSATAGDVPRRGRSPRGAMARRASSRSS